MKNFVTLPHQNKFKHTTAMAALTLTLNVPENSAIDIDILQQKMQAILNVVVSDPSVLKEIDETEYVLSNPKIMEAITEGDEIISSGNFKTTKLEDLWK